MGRYIIPIQSNAGKSFPNVHGKNIGLYISFKAHIHWTTEY